MDETEASIESLIGSLEEGIERFPSLRVLKFNVVCSGDVESGPSAGDDERGLRSPFSIFFVLMH